MSITFRYAATLCALLLPLFCGLFLFGYPTLALYLDLPLLFLGTVCAISFLTHRLALTEADTPTRLLIAFVFFSLFSAYAILDLTLPLL